MECGEKNMNVQRITNCSNMYVASFCGSIYRILCTMKDNLHFTTYSILLNKRIYL